MRPANTMQNKLITCIFTITKSRLLEYMGQSSCIIHKNQAGLYK